MAAIGYDDDEVFIWDSHHELDLWDFLKTYHNRLPVLVTVTQGYMEREGSMHEFAIGEVRIVLVQILLLN